MPAEDVLATLAYAVQQGHLVEHDEQGGVRYSKPGTAILAYDKTSGIKADIDPSAKWQEEEAPLKHGSRWRNIETGDIRYTQPSAGRFAQVGGEEHTADRLNRAQKEGVGVLPGKGVATSGVEARIMMLATEGGSSLQGEGVLSEIINADKRMLKGQAVALAGKLGMTITSSTSKTAALAHIEHALRTKAGSVPKPGDSPKGTPEKQDQSVLSAPAGDDGASGKGLAESPDSSLSPRGDTPELASTGEPHGEALAEKPVDADTPGAETPPVVHTGEERGPGESLKDYMKRRGENKHYKDVAAYARSLHRQAKGHVDEKNAVYDRLAELITDKTGKRFSRRSPLLKDGGDPSQVPGFDEAVDTIADEFPGVFATERGAETRGSISSDEKASNVNKAWAVIKDGMQSYPDAKEFEDQAYEESKAGNFGVTDDDKELEGYNLQDIKPGEEVDDSFDFGANVEGTGQVQDATTSSDTVEDAAGSSTDDTRSGVAEGDAGRGSVEADADRGAASDGANESNTTEPGEAGLVRHPIHVDRDSIFASGKKRGGFSPPSIGMHAFKGANAVWHHQGDPQQTLFNAAQSGASEHTTGKAEEIKAAHKAGYRLQNHRAGKYGSMWVYEKDGKILTDRGAKALVQGKGQANVGEQNGRETAKPVIEQVHKFIAGLPESTKGNLGALVTAINRSPLGEHVTLARDESGKIRLSDKQGTWHVHETTAGVNQDGTWNRDMESSVPRFLHKLEHMATNDMGDKHWATHEREADSYATGMMNEVNTNGKTDDGSTSDTPGQAAQDGSGQGEAREEVETQRSGTPATAGSRPAEGGETLSDTHGNMLANKVDSKGDAYPEKQQSHHRKILDEVDKGGWHTDDDLASSFKWSLITPAEKRNKVATLMRDMVDAGHAQIAWDTEGNPHYAKAGEAMPDHLQGDGKENGFMQQEEAGEHTVDDVPSYAGQSFTNDKGLTVDVRKAQDGTWSVGSQTGLTQAGVANALNAMKAEKAKGLFGDDVTAQGDTGKPKEQLQWKEPAKAKDDGAALPGMRDTFAPGMFGRAATENDEVSPRGDSVSEERLGDLGLYRDFNGKHQYKTVATGSWMTANSKDDAIEQATNTHDATPEDERLTTKERGDKADQELYRVMDSNFGHMTKEQLDVKIAQAGGDAENRAEGEFDGMGGRSSRKATTNEAARQAGQEALQLRVYRDMKYGKGNADGDVSQDEGQSGQGISPLPQEQSGQRTTGRAVEPATVKATEAVTGGGEGALSEEKEGGKAEAQAGEEKKPRADAKPEKKPHHTETAEFKSWFGESKVTGKDGKPQVVYHGTKRPDRVGDQFNPKRATSGPMAFFTDDPGIASNYATNKSDTSINRPDDYAGYFKYKPKGSRSTVNADQMWYHLSREEQDKVRRLMPHVIEDENGGGIKHEEGSGGPGGEDHFNYEIKAARGNVIKAAKEIWLNGGMLHGEEEKFMEVLKHGGVPMDNVKYDDPDAEYPGVYPVYMSMQNPLDTGKIPDHVHEALQQAGKRKRGKEGSGADQWDKNYISGKQWLERLAEDKANGTTHAWTSIPDWVTDTLKEHGYDGIKDYGGKYHDAEHNVWIPFHPHQVKAAYGNKGTYSKDSPKLTYSIERTASTIGES